MTYIVFTSTCPKDTHHYKIAIKMFISGWMITRAKRWKNNQQRLTRLQLHEEVSLSGYSWKKRYCFKYNCLKFFLKKLTRSVIG